MDDLPPLPLCLRPVPALRAAVRLALILAMIVHACIRYHLVPGRRSLRARADWLHRLCLKVLKIIGIRVELAGERPASGLLVLNHLSYLDIILLSAIVRPIFVSKAEVMRWPFFGRAARYGASIFVDRQSRRAVHSVAQAMQQVLAARVPLVLFPEGTSSGGEKVLPFKPSLLSPVTDGQCVVTACGLDYRLPGSVVADEVAYWRDHDFAPHLLNLLSKTGLSARLAFGAATLRSGHRKEIAQALHAEVTGLRNP